MPLFVPDRAYVDPRALKYEETGDIIKKLRDLNVPVINSRNVEINCDTALKNYVKSKKTVYITINNQKKLSPCSPSADFQFSITSSCPGLCEYCYLQTTQGEKPYIKIFININEILNVVQSHIDKRLPQITTFEVSSISDPVSVEHLTGNLKRCIEYFSALKNGKLRVVTKYDNVDSFLDIKHNGNTKFRFSINSRYVINNFEHNTSSFEERIDAARKIGNAGYPLGFIVAPIMIYEGYEAEYRELFEMLGGKLHDYKNDISFELIQHRFTKTAKDLILQRFPGTMLDMEEEKRLLKWGPYGKFKYVYPKEKSNYIKEYISSLIEDNFEKYTIEYFT